jgi:hypothetical protein
MPGQGPAPVQKTMLGHLAPAGSPPTPMPTPSPLAGTPPAPMPVPQLVQQAAPVSLPPPPRPSRDGPGGPSETGAQPDRGLPWALPVALVAIAVVTLAVLAAILFT